MGAMATLTECFNNPKLFTGVVKIRKGLTARLIVGCIDGPDAVHWWFAQFAERLASQVRDRNCVGADCQVGTRISDSCARILGRTNARATAHGAHLSRKMYGGAAIAGAAAVLAVAANRA